MPRELVAVAPRTPVLREYEEPVLGERQIRIRTEFASPKHGTELVAYRDDPASQRSYDAAWGTAVRLTEEERARRFPRPLGNMAVGVVAEVGAAVTPQRTPDGSQRYDPGRMPIVMPAEPHLTLPRPSVVGPSLSAPDGRRG